MMCSDADASCVVLVYLPHTAPTLSSKRNRNRAPAPPPPKKEDCSTAGQEPQMSGESYYNLDEGEKMGFSSRHSLL